MCPVSSLNALQEFPFSVTKVSYFRFKSSLVTLEKFPRSVTKVPLFSYKRSLFSLKSALFFWLPLPLPLPLPLSLPLSLPFISGYASCNIIGDSQLPLSLARSTTLNANTFSHSHSIPFWNCTNE